MTDNCKIEVDFGRQSFRVFRGPFLQQPEPSTSVPSSPCLKKLQGAYSDKSLTIFDKNRPLPSPTLQLHSSRLGKQETKVQPSRNEGIAAGGILTSIHVPLKADDNFNRIFNQMLPVKKTVCLCKRPRQEVDMNKIVYDLVNSVYKANTTELGDLPSVKGARSPLIDRVLKRKSMTSFQSTDLTFWIGSEYRYNVYSEKLVLKFVLIGKPPEHAKQLYIDIQVSDRNMNKRKRVKLNGTTQENEIGKQISIPMISYLRTLEAEVHATLTINRGFLRRVKRIDEWQFPLNNCHCMYPRSFWWKVKY